MKIFVLGCAGQLGRCLHDQFFGGDHHVIFLSRAEFDLSNVDELKDFILDERPSIIINAAAYTAVDKAEEDFDEANKINHLSVEKLAIICREAGCWLIHISTDYVFDGLASHPYNENSQVNPKSTYGWTKLEGELAIQRSGCKYLIVRTAWVFSEYGNNFLKTMLRLGSERNELSIVDDQIGCPTYGQDIAKAIVAIVSRLDTNEVSSGVFHFGGDRSCSWLDFARVIFDEAQVQGLAVPCKLISVSTAHYPTPAVRPRYSVLDCCKIADYFGVLPSDWQAGVRTVIKRLQTDRGEAQASTE